ncbi:MAG: Crp/Fnr family transcriptional regulator [Terriglobales bacterium]
MPAQHSKRDVTSAKTARGARQNAAPRNAILAALPAQEYHLLAPHLTPVPLTAGQTLYEPNRPVSFGYFPTRGLVCMLAGMHDGATVEVGMMGIDGFVGIAILLAVHGTPLPVTVEIPGSALRIEADRMHRLLPRTPNLDLLLRRFVQQQLTQVAQCAACNSLHSVRERVARWLLMAHSRAATHPLPVTHDSLARMLGCRRPSITTALRSLCNDRFIECGRGHIDIVSRPALETATCECYAVIDSSPQLASATVR